MIEFIKCGTCYPYLKYKNIHEVEECDICKNREYIKE